jgi:hypothetical protein
LDNSFHNFAFEKSFYNWCIFLANGGSTGAPPLTRYMTKYDDLKNPPRTSTHDVRKVLSNVVRVICSRTLAVAAPGMSLAVAAAATMLSLASPTALAVVGMAVKGSVASAVGLAVTATAAAGAPNSSVTATAAVKVPLARVVSKAKIDYRMTAITNVAMPDNNVLGRIEVKSSQAKLRTFRLVCERAIILKNTGGATEEIFSENMLRRYKLSENQTSDTWTDLAFAEVSSDDWDETRLPKARLSKWSLLFTTKKKCDMRLHHIFITSISSAFGEST